MSGLRCVHPASREVFSQGRLSAAISRLLVVVVCQSHFFGHAHASGISAKVGMRIFSIARGSGFLGGQSRGSARWQREVQGLRLLHRPKRLGELWVRVRSPKSLVEGSTKREQCTVRALSLQDIVRLKEGVSAEMLSL